MDPYSESSYLHVGHFKELDHVRITTRHAAVIFLVNNKPRFTVSAANILLDNNKPVFLEANCCLLEHDVYVNVCQVHENTLDPGGEAKTRKGPNYNMYGLYNRILASPNAVISPWLKHVFL